MSDQTINQTHVFLKNLDVRVKKLGRTVDQLDILAYRYQRLSTAYKDFAETLAHIDVVAFEIRQEFDQIAEVYDEFISKIRLTFP